MRLKERFLNVFGLSGISGAIIALAIFVLSIYLERVFYLKRIQSNISLAIAIILVIAWAILTLWTMFSLPIYVRGKKLVRTGIYAHVRHPLYSAGIFFLYPSLALFAKSWAALISTLLVYVEFIWIVKLEEKYLLKIFGKEYEKYIKEVDGFIPKMRTSTLQKKKRAI